MIERSIKQSEIGSDTKYLSKARCPVCGEIPVGAHHCFISPQLRENKNYWYCLGGTGGGLEAGVQESFTDEGV